MIKGADNNYYGDIEGLRGRKDPEAIRIVAKELEAIFAQELIKAMRKTTGESSRNSLGNDTYMSMFDMELAKLFSERGLGLQEMLLKGLSRIAEKTESQKFQNTENQERLSSVGDKPLAENKISSLSPPSPLPPQKLDEKSFLNGGKGETFSLKVKKSAGEEGLK